jgi:formylglycine-generating enzyme required for sulfatase activity
MLTETDFAAMVKVFISYSHDDKQYCDNIRNYLEQYRDSIDVWADHGIKAGDEWDETILENLREADIILFLISINFIRSKYIKDNELSVGYELRQAGSAEIIPILLTECDWVRVDELTRFQALPIDPNDKRAQFIDNWDEDRRAPVYNSIARAIYEKASVIINNRQVREKNEKLQRYREKCQEFLSKSPALELSIAHQHILQYFCKDLGISDAEAEKAFEEVQEPFRICKKNRERYLNTVKVYLLDRVGLSAEKTKADLKDLQREWKLEDSDISALQPEIDRLAEDQRAKEEEESKAREEEAKRKADAERLAEEQRSKEEEDRKAREEEAKRRAEADRLAEEQRAKEEEERKAREEEAKRKADAERLASECLAKEVREQQALAQVVEQGPKQAQNQKQPELQALSVPSAVLVQESRGLKRLLGPSWRIDRGAIQAKAYQQPLSDGIAITMVQIPAGSFQMGSPDTEAERAEAEGPQHRVQLQSFFLGQTPVNQAQWKEVASWPQVNLKLNPNPANFKGANRPVEQVSWEEAMEFCRRLSQRTNLFYTLPSEAQWEYACRAGTTTPFAFGDTLTPDIANYDGNSTYGSGPKDQYRQETTKVGSFAANAWGLQDMHGNLWEWCLDHWHYDYRGAPDDGSAWVIGGDQTLRLLRGGSWLSNPRYCRSACRCRWPLVNRNCRVGFRLCRFPPGLVS